ncbi:hypothetical protein CEV31_3719 [Brucella thiophenivorans]|uniref:Uncharacterized protein n=1 Tax=Brucella thiophenivorans TaxID=571255 RepID=A0A256FA31_9HYPH|nr:hypothetical protein CEV31_3719 [Brucella thiophenivorans]
MNFSWRIVIVSISDDYIATIKVSDETLSNVQDALVLKPESGLPRF